MASDLAVEFAFVQLPAGTTLERGSQTRTKCEEVLQTVLNQPGCRGGQIGSQVEDPSLGYFLLEWDAVSDHEKFMAQDYYKTFTDRISQLISGLKTLSHVHSRLFPGSAGGDEVSAALRGPHSPVTEFFTIYFAADVSQAARDQFDANARRFWELALRPGGATAAAGGWTVEKLPVPGKDVEGVVYLFAIGWHSVEAHLKCRDTDAFRSNAHLVRGQEGQLAAAAVHYKGELLEKV